LETRVHRGEGVPWVPGKRWWSREVARGINPLDRIPAMAWTRINRISSPVA
jgi:hypothetical protein